MSSGEQVNDQPAKSGIANRRESRARVGGEAYKDRRKQIIAAAAQIFNEKGYEATNFNDIAQRLSADRASLYYYAASKEELLNEIVSVVLDENVRVAKTISAQRGNARERLSALVREMMESYDRNYPFMYVHIQDIARVAAQETKSAQQTLKRAREFEAMVAKILRDGQVEGLFREDVDIEVVKLALFGMINWTYRWYKPGGPSSPRDVADTFCALFFDGFALPEAR